MSDGEVMKRIQFVWGLAFAIGLFFVAGYSIDNHGFHSGIYGLVGSALLLGSYVGLSWSKIKAGDRHTRRLVWLLGGLLLLMLLLDIADAVLAR